MYITHGPGIFSSAGHDRGPFKTITVFAAHIDGNDDDAAAAGLLAIFSIAIQEIATKSSSQSGSISQPRLDVVIPSQNFIISPDAHANKKYMVIVHPPLMRKSKEASPAEAPPRAIIVPRLFFPRSDRCYYAVRCTYVVQQEMMNTSDSAGKLLANHGGIVVTGDEQRHRLYS